MKLLDLTKDEADELEQLLLDLIYGSSTQVIPDEYNLDHLISILSQLE